MCNARLGALLLAALSACANATTEEEPLALWLQQQPLEITPTWIGDAAECGNVEADAVVQTRGSDVKQVPSTSTPLHLTTPDVSCEPRWHHQKVYDGTGE